ncbi:MAG TPA: penicillin-binding transpeptidase domain-containing protein, partial [Bacilli bacterium]
SMTVIAVDPYSLEVLGLANLPNFNPNNYWDFTDQNVFKNHALVSTYEPGSTFKIVTLAGAAQEGLFHPEATYESGRLKVPGTTIRDHNNGQGWGKITFLEGLKRSSNVAFVKLGYEGLQEDRLRKYITDFGFGTKTNIGLQGELAGDIDFQYPSEIATATFGQGVTVTPIQQITAVSAIANGGKLMWPHLVREVVDQEETNKVITAIQPKEIKQVISKKTAQDVRGYLEQVVSDRKIGTGRNAYIEGYRVAGKTGTAQKVENGKYSDDKWVVSFIGFAPVDNPKIVVCIIVDEPDLQGDSNGASMVSGPLFKEVVTKSLRYMEVPATAKQGATAIKWASEKAIVPELTNLSASEAESKLNAKKLKYEILGKGKKVLKQYPDPEDETGIEQMIYLITDDIDTIKFPDLTGKALRDAIEVCSLLEVTCKASGEGYVSSQTVLGAVNNRSVLLKLVPISRVKLE